MPIGDDGMIIVRLTYSLVNPQSRSETLGSEADIPSIIHSTPRTGESLPTGYLGPTSFVLGPEDDGDLISNAGEHSAQGGRGGLVIAPSPLWMKRVSEVLHSLTNFLTIKHLIHEYYEVTQTAVIASPLILNALAEIEITFESLSDNGTSEHLSALSASIIQNTAKTFQIPKDATGKMFHKCFTGSSLRLEIIGIICALAGRASYFGLSRSSTSNAESQAHFFRKMLAACDVALHVCRHLTILNDLTLWLVHENLLLSSLLFSDSSSITWQRLGELATNIFELGVHRDTASSTALPLFILESRRRLFAAAYQLDKGIATFLGRPPRISWRHSDCCLPLDISDHVLTEDFENLEAVQTSLDPQGWSMKKAYQRATWIRLRFIVSTFREEILELSLQKSSPERTDQLMSVSRRCNEAWNSLPKHLHYTLECWGTDLPTSVKLMLLISYLAYLYNEFLVQSLLTKDSGETSASQLDVSATIISTVLTLGRQWERSVAIQRDFTWIILLYGVPGASVLIRALQKQARTGQPMLYSGSQASLIRNLSVFISHLEPMARPDQTSSTYFNRTAAIFTRILDEILEPRLEIPASDRDTEHNFDVDFDSLFSMDLEGIQLLENTDFGASFGQML
ncbi:Transcription factor [Penicillium maclennaniae]|uniref:Transcription factor n=1 Tax=Penicillium maclennaniae TaxID=1343394 RepID=UPI00253F6E81|nr:Transcription factor [Penicillium maclennaniae]KAJ5668548.1 Transcription factor [Penicillium maclennaniae]